jgi:hypothetical protein
LLYLSHERLVPDEHHLAGRRHEILDHDDCLVLSSIGRKFRKLPKVLLA